MQHYLTADGQRFLVENQNVRLAVFHMRAPKKRYYRRATPSYGAGLTVHEESTTSLINS